MIIFSAPEGLFFTLLLLLLFYIFQGNGTGIAFFKPFIRTANPVPFNRSGGKAHGE
jgi:hypothetical protein